MNKDLLYGKLPPQAKEFEDAVLGAIMLDKRAIEDVADFLRPEMFYSDANQKVYAAILALYHRSSVIDLLTVVEEIKKHGQLEDVGGAYYVTMLTNNVVSSAHIINHAYTIKDKFIKRELIRISGQSIAAAYEDTDSSEAVLTAHEQALNGLSSDNSVEAPAIDEALMPVFKNIYDLKNNGRSITGVPSGYRELDRITHGWQRSDLIILAARPSVGKTAFGLNLALNAAQHVEFPTSVAFFSLEMNRDQLIKRLLSCQSQIGLDRLMTGNLTDENLQTLYEKGAQELATVRIFIDDTHSLSIHQIKAKARRLYRKRNIELIVIDYLQLMSGSGERKGQNREQEIAEISRGLKGLAKELNIPIIALSQLSREVEKRSDKRPVMSDLRESGAIEQDADLVMFLYRPEYYNISTNEHGEATSGLTELSITKHRNGRLASGSNALKFAAKLDVQRFEKWEGELPESAQVHKWKPISSSSF